MSISAIRLELINNKGEKLTFAAMNPTDEPTTPEEFSKAIMSIMEQVGQATTLNQGFIEFDNNGGPNEEPPDGTEAQ